jgi:hypothetical protein
MDIVVLELLTQILKQNRKTHKWLKKLRKQESAMNAKVDQAFKDFDTEIATITSDISDLVARLASTPPSDEANAIADQIEAKISALKSAAAPLKNVAVVPTAAPVVTDVPVAAAAPGAVVSDVPVPTDANAVTATAVASSPVEVPPIVTPQPAPADSGVSTVVDSGLTGAPIESPAPPNNPVPETPPADNPAPATPAVPTDGSSPATIPAPNPDAPV